jgi:hypothetical protein
MKYMKIEASDKFSVDNITIELENSGYSFPATIGNSFYDTFLVSQNLTDKQVQALEPNIWHEMKEPVSAQVEIVESVEEITEDGTE